MDPPVLEQLLEREPGDLAPDAVEAGEHHRAGRVVDDEVDPGQVLERADVAALPADDPALHVVGGQLHHRHGRLGGVAGGEPLHADREDVADPALGLALGLLLDLAEAAGGVVLGLVLDLLEQQLLGLGRRTCRPAPRACARPRGGPRPARRVLARARTRACRGVSSRRASASSRRSRLALRSVSVACSAFVASRSALVATGRRPMRAAVEDGGDHDSDRDERCGTDDFHGRSSRWTHSRRGWRVHCIRFLMGSDRAARSVRRTEALQARGSPPSATD